eukprot:jgi/Hompol1/573/HPOL_002556-RA
MEKAQTRCIIERDAGKTKAGKKGMFCIHFARGCCSKGKDCTFLHRIPMPGDRTETTIDCFGRDKHRLDRDDMGGVGSFERLNTTLYVGHVSIGDDMESIVRKHFSEWGEIEHINILEDKGVAFVRYVHIPNAEFAKEAMFAQSLDAGEVLNVRWATDDPNPKVIAQNKRKAEKIVEQAVKAKLPKIGDAGTIADYEKSFKNQRLDASAPSADQVAQYQKMYAQQLSGVPHYAPDNAAASYYAYYASYGYFPSADGSGFVYDPARAQNVGGNISSSASQPIQESASSAYAIPVRKQQPVAEATLEPDQPAAAPKSPPSALAPKPLAIALVSGYGSDDDDDDDDDDNDNQEEQTK